MARLGELLVAAGLVTAGQVEQALRAQVMWGGRLGTNLVELGHLDLDDLARTLGRQHRIPAALARHFDRGDPTLQERVAPELAERHAVVPLFRSGKQRDRIAIVSSALLPPDVLAQLADALGVTVEGLVPSIAAELRIAYYLERVYRIPRDLRFLRPRKTAVPAFLHFEVSAIPPDSEPDLVLASDTQELPVLRPPPPGTAEVVEPDAEPTGAGVPLAGEMDPDTAPLRLEGDDDSIPPPSRFERLDRVDPDGLYDTLRDAEPDEPEEIWDHERRRYVRTITDEMALESEPQAVGRIALRRIAVAGSPGAAGATLAEAVRAIRRGTDRDRVADLVLDAIDRFVPACEAAILLVKRGDVAISWKGFARGGSGLPELAVPIGVPDPPGLVSRAIDTGATAHGRAGDLGPVDLLLRRSLGDAGGELAVVPISIGGQVMCAIALTLAPSASAEEAETLAAAAGTAFAQLMRAASR
jgi:hypothetical protein